MVVILERKEAEKKEGSKEMGEKFPGQSLTVLLLKGN